MRTHLSSLCCAALVLTACGGGSEEVVLTEEERLAAPADAEFGRRLYRACGVCHDAKPAEGHRVGPNLWGIVGAEAGRHADFAYSRALERSGLTWDEATLDAYIRQPRDVLPDGRMAYPGMASEADRRDLLAYLATLEGTPD